VGHDIEHWLDDLRHFLAYAFAPFNFISNISAEVVQIVVIGVLVLLFRNPLRRLYHRLQHHLLGKHLIALEERLSEKVRGHHVDTTVEIKQHVTDELLAQDKRLAALVEPPPKPASAIISSHVCDSEGAHDPLTAEPD
jgi:hypothetical protein